VLIAARALDEALPAGDANEMVSLANRLMASALARESGGGVVAGFRGDDSLHDAAATADTIAAPATVEEELSLALTELEVGEVLLCSAAATLAPQAARADASSALSDAIDHLDIATGDLAKAGVWAVSGLIGKSKPTPKDFFDQLPETVNGIIKRTANHGLATVGGLTKIPIAHLEPAFATAWSAAGASVNGIAGVGALVKVALRAIERALKALARLVPEKIGQQIRNWTEDWWNQHAEHVAEILAQRVLSAAELQAFIEDAIKDAKAAVNEAAENAEAAISEAAEFSSSLTQGYSRLVALDGQHARISKVIERIINVLSRLIGPLAIAFPAAAPWVYVSGGSGMVTAMGVSVWVGRDYLDAGVPFEHVPGVRVIVTDAIITPVQKG
jgi:hypothetical protein